MTVTVPAHPDHPEWPSLDEEYVGYGFIDACETLGLRVLTSFCYHHHDIITASLFGLFPPRENDDPDWLSRFLSAEQVVAADPRAAAQLYSRCMKAFKKMHDRKSEAALKMFNLLTNSVTATVTRELELSAATLQINTKDTQIAALAEDLANLQVTHNATTLELQQTRDELQGVRLELDISNELVVDALQEAAQAQAQLQQAAAEANSAEADASMMEDAELPDAPPSPTNSVASVNFLGDN